MVGVIPLLSIQKPDLLGLEFMASGGNGLDKGQFELENKLKENIVGLFSSTH